MSGERIVGLSLGWSFAWFIADVASNKPWFAMMQLVCIGLMLVGSRRAEPSP